MHFHRHFPRALAGALFVAALAAPALVTVPAHAQETAVVPVPHAPADAREGRARRLASRYMMIGGGALFAGGYLTNVVLGFGAGYRMGSVGFGSLGGGSSGGHNAGWSEFRDWSYVPLVGPFMQLSLMPPGAREGDWPGLLAATAVMQVVGLGVLLGGLVLGLLDGGETTDDKPGPALSVVPSITPTDLGVVATGRF